jgi:putative SOS response-associated peptidase YedK
MARHFSNRLSLKPGHRSLLKPYPDELMVAYDVSAIVNSAKYDGPECIKPVSEDDIPRGGQLSLLL